MPETVYSPFGFHDVVREILAKTGLIDPSKFGSEIGIFQKPAPAGHIDTERWSYPSGLVVLLERATTYASLEIRLPTPEVEPNDDRLLNYLRENPHSDLSVIVQKEKRGDVVYIDGLFYRIEERQLGPYDMAMLQRLDELSEAIQVRLLEELDAEKTPTQPASRKDSGADRELWIAGLQMEAASLSKQAETVYDRAKALLCYHNATLSDEKYIGFFQALGAVISWDMLQPQ